VRTVLLVDRGRQDEFARGPRTLLTEVWYPAAEDSRANPKVKFSEFFGPYKAEAGRFLKRDLDSIDRDFRSLAVRDAPLRSPPGGRWTLLLFSHGNGGFRHQNAFQAEHLASHGFVVAAPDLPGVARPGCQGGTETPDPEADVAFVVGALRDRAGPAALFASALRRGRYGLVGHSFGGLVSLETCLADRNARVVALLAPFTTIDGAELGALRPRLATFVAGATGDTRIPFESSALFFDGLAAPAFLEKIVGGTHSGFGEDDTVSSPEEIARQHELVRRYVTAFLLRYLGGERPLRRVLTPEDAAAVGDDVELVARPRR
jgi:pimeloyl-ACP methyl ester carboxylesterase